MDAYKCEPCGVTLTFTVVGPVPEIPKGYTLKPIACRTCGREMQRVSRSPVGVTFKCEGVTIG